MKATEWPVVFVLLLLFGVSQPTQACRCPERPLADYYAAADEVWIAAITALDEIAVEGSVDAPLDVSYTVIGDAWKGARRSGEQGRFITSRSSASCGLNVQVGEAWVLFIHGDTRSAQLTSCDGSRPLRSNEGKAPGFAKVPTRFVAEQLTALAGLDILRAITSSDQAALIGLLDIEALAHGGSVPLYQHPEQQEQPITTLSSMAPLRQREASYEFPAAEVYAVADFGYQVRLLDGRLGWLPRDYAGTWFPYENLLVNRLNYLQSGWHGFLWPDAGAGIPLRVAPSPAADGRWAAAVHEVADIGGTLWLRVDVLSSDGCEAGTVRTIASGWTPASLASGEPAAWFYSRGC